MADFSVKDVVKFVRLFVTKLAGVERIRFTAQA